MGLKVAHKPRGIFTFWQVFNQEMALFTPGFSSSGGRMYHRQSPIPGLRAGVMAHSSHSCIFLTFLFGIGNKHCYSPFGQKEA